MTIHVSLPEELELMVHAQVESGLYKSASEVVREALRDFFAEKSLFSPEQMLWIQEEIAPRLEAVQNGTATLIPAESVFEELDQRLS